MNYLRIIALIFVLSIVLYSCDVVNQVINESVNVTSELPLSEAEVAKGLKRALNIGAESAVSGLSTENGFYKSPSYKILLPPEAKVITDNKDNALLKAVGISKLIEDVEVNLNTAAEHAVVKAKPIFINAITSMSIQDAFGILNGGDTAASHFLRNKTYQELYKLFIPEVSKALN